MIGKKFGKWTVLNERLERKYGLVIFEVVCECGNNRDIAGTVLRSGKTNQCRECYQTVVPDAVGKRFGDRYVIGKIRKKSGMRNNVLFYQTLCDRDHVAYVLPKELKRISIGSCIKCKYPDIVIEPNHPLRTTWDNMRQRCDNPHSPNYANYGGRGINYDPLWKSFAVFLEDVGDRPEGMTLDRIDNNLGYFLGNVRWATMLEQAHNKRIQERHTRDWVGKKFGKWTVVKRSGSNKRGDRLWECICVCGIITTNATCKLNEKSSSQCKKCHAKELGLSNSKRTRSKQAIKKD